MKCLIFQPNNSAIELNVSYKSYGYELLNKICNKLNIIEVNFFGLQFMKNGRSYWLLLQKRLDQQKQQLNSNKKYLKLYFRVKFLVQPHYIQQITTKHQFYLNILHFLEQYQKYLELNDEKCTKLIALISQCEYGDYNHESYDLKILYLKWIRILFNRQINYRRLSTYNLKNNCKIFDESSVLNNKNDSNQSNIKIIIEQIIIWHQKFNGFSKAYCQHLFLKETYDLENGFGIDYYQVMSNKRKLTLGIGPRGLIILTDGNISNNGNKIIPYNKLKEIHHLKTNHFINNKFIVIINYNHINSNLLIEEKFIMKNYLEYEQFYRLLIERRTFYTLPLIDNQQFISLHDDTGAAITRRLNTQYSFISNFIHSFNMTRTTITTSSTSINNDHNDYNNNNGLIRRMKSRKKFHIYDIDKTMKQFYDDIRRYIYHFNNQFDRLILTNGNLTTNNSLLSSMKQIDNFNDNNDLNDHHNNDNIDRQQQQIDNNNNNNANNSETQLNNNRSLTCKLCLNEPISIAFIDCGHTSCNVCYDNIIFIDKTSNNNGASNNINICPFCKCKIQSKQKIFF